MDPNKLVDLQIQMRRNQEDLAEYLHEMESWEKDIKVKEEHLASKAIAKDPALLPPVRNSLTKKVLKKKKKKNAKDSAVNENKPRRIRGSDYRSWDRFDVEKACGEVDAAEQHHSSSSEYETDEEMEELRRKQLANGLKDEGNQFFKKEQYDMAIERYSKGLEVDSENLILLLNRAMALLKQEKYGAAEQDCTKAILLGTRDPKAWFRRGCAREALKHYEEALADFKEVMKLDPRNKVAHGKIDAIQNILNPEPPSNIIKAVYIPPEKRSKKPLRRVPIEEIGLDNKEEQSYHKNIKTNQSTDFDRFLTKNSGIKTEQSDPQTSKTVPLVSEMDELPKRKILEESKDLPETELQSSVANRTISRDTDLLKSEKDQATTQGETNKKAAEIKHDVLPSEEDQNANRGEMSRNTSDSYSDVQQSTPRKSEVPLRAESQAELKSATFLTVPKNSCQFQAHWKVLQKKAYEFFVYFKQIDPKDYRSLFTVAFDDELLTKIVSCLQEFYIREDLDVFPVLDQLTKVQRFSTIVMFLSSKYKQTLMEIFKHMESTGKYEEAKLKTLEKLYRL